MEYVTPWWGSGLPHSVTLEYFGIRATAELPIFSFLHLCLFGDVAEYDLSYLFVFIRMKRGSLPMRCSFKFAVTSVAIRQDWSTRRIIKVSKTTIHACSTSKLQITHKNNSNELVRWPMLYRENDCLCHLLMLYIYPFECMQCRFNK